MPNYFQSSRTKYGRATLLIACILMIAWLRSFFMAECLQSRTWQLTSFRGGLFIEGTCEIVDLNFSYYSVDAAYQRDAYSDPSLIDSWHWRRFGFAYGEMEGLVKATDSTQHLVRGLRFCMPYWSFVIPLIVLSAWLLLSKPRSKPNENYDKPSAPAV